MSAARNNKTAAKEPAAASGHSSKIVVALLTVVPCLTAAVCSSNDSDARPLLVTTSRPALVFTEYLADYGPAAVPQQPTLTPIFYLRNNGKQTVKITDMVPDCGGCMAPSISAKEIEPGAVEKLSLPIRLSNKSSGPHEFLVTVHYVDPKPRQVTLTVKAVLPEKSLIVEPRVLMVMGATAPGQQHVVMISDFRPERLEHPMEVTGVTGSSSLFTAELAGQTNQEGASRTSISVQFSENPPKGRHRGFINVATDDTLFPMIQIPVVVGDNKRDPSDAVHASPESAKIVLNSASPAESVGTVVTFDLPSRWKVTHCDTFPTEILAKYESASGQTAERQTISVQLSITDLPTRGIEKAILTLNALDGDVPEMVTVPVSLVWK